VTKKQWLTSTDPMAMLDHVWRCSRSSDRIRRLLAVAFCRRVWHLFTDPRSRAAIEVAERFADEQAGPLELAEADEGAKEAWDELYFKAAPHRYASTAMVANKVARPVAAHGPRDAIDCLPPAAANPHDPSGRGQALERVEQANLLREVFGPWAFRSPALDSLVLAWNGGTVQRLAQAAYDDRQLPAGHLDPDRLQILADALEEAGADVELLSHLRGPGPHVRGCWAADLALGLS
jgi:hypothetical protein